MVAAALVLLGGGAWLLLRIGPTGMLPRLFRAGRDDSRELDQANSLCRNLNVAGNRYARSGRFDSALSCYREALRIAEKHALTARMAASYQDISNVFDFMNEPESTGYYLGKATALRQLSRRRSDQISTLLEWGTFRFRNLGDLDSGRVLLEGALSLCRRSGDFWTEGVVLNNLGALHAALEDYDSARVLYQAAAAASHRVSDRATEAGALHNLARICLLRDDQEAALAWLFKAMEVAHAGELFSDEIAALRDAALIRMETRRFNLARVHLEKAIELCKKIRDYDAMAECRFCLDLLQDVERFKRRVQALDSCFQQLRNRAGQM